jgi:8-oxo-dGTP diphosphatase
MRESFLPGAWGLPCGKVDISHGEDPRHAAIRELNEETGLQGKILYYAGRSKFVSNWHGRTVANIQRNYLVRPLPSFNINGNRKTSPRADSNTTQFAVKLPEVDQAYEWIDLHSLGRFGLDELNLRAIRKALAPCWRYMKSIDIPMQLVRRLFRRTFIRSAAAQGLPGPNRQSAG